MSNDEKAKIWTPEERAFKYADSAEPAVSGCHGRLQFLKVCSAVTVGFDLSADTALPIIKNYNDRCLPPFCEKDVLRAIRDAPKTCGRTAGYLLEADRPGYSNPFTARTSTAAAGGTAQRQQDAPAAYARYREEEAAEKRRQREKWPDCTDPTDEQISTIATRRGVHQSEVLRLIHMNFLRCCRYRGHACHAISHAPDFRQVRRLDGERCTWIGGDDPPKTYTLPGSIQTGLNSFLNPGGLGGSDVPVILTEGCISLVECMEAVRRAEEITGRLVSVAVLAAVWDGARFISADGEKNPWLERLKNRRIRIYQDAGKAGETAVLYWREALLTVGCTVDIIAPPAGCKDLGDALQQIPAGDSYWPDLFNF